MYAFCLNSMKQLINSYFRSKEPWQIVAITSTTILTSIWLWNFIFQDESMIIYNTYK